MDHSLPLPDPPTAPPLKLPVLPTPIQTVAARLHLVSRLQQHSYTVCVRSFVFVPFEGLQQCRVSLFESAVFGAPRSFQPV